MAKKFMWSFKAHECVPIKLPNSPILSLNQELNSIMVNKVHIQGEIREFFTYYSNLIKSDDEYM